MRNAQYDLPMHLHDLLSLLCFFENAFLGLGVFLELMLRFWFILWSSPHKL